MSNKKSDMGKPKSVLMGVIGFIILVLADQWTKKMAVLCLKDQDPIVLIKNVFELEYLENRGAAFGMLQGKQFFFIFCVALIAFFSIYFYRTVPMTKHFLPLRICAVLIVGGAFGNCIDRIRLNYVVDFFYFKLIDFPIFNVADIYVVVACFVFLLLVLFYYKEADFEYLFPNKTKKTEK